MIRLLITVVLALVANAIGLLVAAAVLDDMTLDAAGFFIALGLFTLTVVIVRPLIVQIGMKSAPALAGSSALLATLVGLVVTSLLTDGLQITGAITWVLATVIVWLISMIGGLVLPALFLKRRVAERRT